MTQRSPSASPTQLRPSLGTGLSAGLVVLLLTMLTVIQIRSQADVARSLEGQDNTSLAFLIDNLHRSNAELAQETARLAVLRETLRTGAPAAVDAQLAAEATRLRILEGGVPVSGPGVTVRIDAPLNQLDIQEAVNNLRAAGAEAIAVSGLRVVTGSVIQQSGQNIEIDGLPAHGPWEFTAVGDPAQLVAAAAQMTRTLRSDPRVRASSYEPANPLTISAVVRQRPFVYALTS
jgi:uncharacterized protein YlxW (UPF0749 family)